MTTRGFSIKAVDDDGVDPMKDQMGVPCQVQLRLGPKKDFGVLLAVISLPFFRPDSSPRSPSNDPSCLEQGSDQWDPGSDQRDPGSDHADLGLP